jgi:hypothetical protein
MPASTIMGENKVCLSCPTCLAKNKNKKVAPHELQSTRPISAIIMK